MNKYVYINIYIYIYIYIVIRTTFNILFFVILIKSSKPSANVTKSSALDFLSRNAFNG